MESKFIKKIKDNKKEIYEWYSKNIKNEDNDFIMRNQSQDAIVRIKIIKTPESRRDDLLTIDILNDSQIKTVTFFELFPHQHVPIHNHRDVSYMTPDYKTRMFNDNDRKYKSTHITFETNVDAYMTYLGEDIRWEKDIFNEYNLLDNMHSGTNSGDTSVKFLYIDYFDDVTVDELSQ
jgi:hypothetical protein